MTSIGQSLDVRINGPLKKAIRKEYILCNSKNSVFSIKHTSKSDAVRWIMKNWEDPNIITKENIINSFRATGILECKNNVVKYEQLDIWKMLKEKKH